VLTADPAFLGRPEHLNPEQLLVIAASSCQLLSFLAVAARTGVDILAYEDDAQGVMPDQHPVSITRVTLRPRIVVATGPTIQQIHHLVELAHRQCYIANSLRTEIDVAPQVEFAPAAGS
jgi:organic hydroperoxide reductase OsmC/OhrA